jgi:hypothetical protein
MVGSLPVLHDYFMDLLRTRHPEALARGAATLALD